MSEASSTEVFLQHEYDHIIQAVVIRIAAKATSSELKKAMREILVLYLPHNPWRWLVDVRQAQNLPTSFRYWLSESWWKEEVSSMLLHRHVIAYVLSPDFFSDKGLQKVNDTLEQLEQEKGTQAPLIRERYFASLISARAWLFAQPSENHTLPQV